jgi:predicted Zn-dependent protease
LVAKFASVTASERGAATFLRNLDGIDVGDRREDGIVRGHRFLHPGLRISVEFPQGWEVTNATEQVAAQEAGQKHYMFLQLVEGASAGRTIEDVAQRSMAAARFQRLDGRRTALNGATAYVGLYRGELSGFGRVTLRAAHIENGRQVLMLAGFAPEATFARIDRDVAAAIESYRPLSAREADAIRPNRLTFYTVRAGDSWQSIAARHGSLVKASDLAIMNGHEVHEQPASGERIKIVVEG